jgi:hypothetical protein
VRTPLVLLSLCLVGLLALAGPGSARSNARTHFVITGGTVTIALSSDLIDTLAADHATLSATGGAVMTTDKAKQSTLTLPVIGGLAHNATIELAPNCRCVSFSTRGTLLVTGNGKTMTLTKPQFIFDSQLKRNSLVFQFRGAGQSALIFPPITLPRSLAGNSFSLTGLVTKVDPNARGIFQGYEAHLGDPGDGAAPNFPYDRAVGFGTISIKLKLVPLK